jgi:hypothetical protein
MKNTRNVLLIATLSLLTPSSIAARQDHILCSTNPTGPFLVTSGAPFTTQWIMVDTTVDTGGATVPNRVDGFYLQIDNGVKEDIGMATALTPCSATSPKPGDIPYTYRTSSGVSRGSHNLKISAWNYTLDGVGNPTTTRQESVVASIPFTAGDPILFGPPTSPQNVIIVAK